MTSNKKLRIELSSQKKEDLIFLKELMEEGRSNLSLTENIHWNRLPMRTGMLKRVKN